MNKFFFHHRLNPERFCCISVDRTSMAGSTFGTIEHVFDNSQATLEWILLLI
jgi:hypothetical protein